MDHTSTRAPSFPVRAFIQDFGGPLPPDFALVAHELQSRGVTVSTSRVVPRGVTRDDLIVGDFTWTRAALEQLGVPMPTPPDYPDCLRHLLHRRVWGSTLGEIRALLGSASEHRPANVFIKPAEDTKAFSAIIEPRDQMIGALLDGIPGVLDPLPATLPVHCAEVVSLVGEFRAYVVHGSLRAVCQYAGPPSAAAALDRGVVESAVRTLAESDEGRDLVGCALDFAILGSPGADTAPGAVTCLVEVNDGYSLGRYEGLSGRDYTDLLVARWQRLVHAEAPARVPAAASVAPLAFPQRFGGGGGADGAPAFGWRNTSASVILPSAAVGGGGGSQLLLGSFGDACDVAALAAQGVRTIVNCTSECELPAAVVAALGDGGRVEVLGLLDVETADLAGALPRALRAIDVGLSSSHSVLVHCAQGVSRSASVVLAFLVRHRGFSLADSWAHVSARRDVVPNLGFWAQLLAFELAERGRLSVTPAQLRGHDTWAFVFDSDADAAAYFGARGLPAP